MPSLIYSLLYDLRQRCRYLLEEMERLRPNLLGEAVPYYEWLRGEIEQRLHEIELVITDPDLAHPALAKQYHLAYKGLAQRLSILEENSFQALRTFDAGSQFLTLVVRQICRESNFPGESPLCSTVSTSYYWAIPWARLIFAPPTEAAHLLALPDLYHELAHFIIEQHRSQVVGPIIREINEHYVKFKTECRLNGWSDASLAQLDEAFERWVSKWYEEFAADVIATYWVGPAFGWTNIRVCANISGALFSGNFEHPADNARADAIERTLRELGHTGEADRLREGWNQFIETSGQVPSTDYEQSYPSGLLDAVVRVTVAACRSLGLVPFLDSNPHATSVPGILNFAWEEFRRSPSEYCAFEREAFKKLTGLLRAKD